MTEFNGTDYTFASFSGADGYAYAGIWDQFWGDVIEEMEARAAALAGGLIATSSTNNVPIGTGTKTLTVEAGKGFVANMWVGATDAANPANYMVGTVSSYNATTGALVLYVPTGGTAGSGTPSSWTVGIAGKIGATGATGAAGAGPVWYGTSGGTANAQTLSGALSVLTGNPSVEFIAGATNGSVTRTNLLPYSKQLDNAAYGKGMVTVTADAAVWIDGTMVMDKIVETATTGAHALALVSVSGLTASTTYTLSVYLKAAERTKGRLSFLDSSFADGVIAAFDLSAGTVAASASGAGSNATAAIDALPGGIYRVSITGRMNNSRTTGGLYLNLRDGTGADSYAGVSGSGLYAVGAQLETGTVATPLITTAASSVSVSDGHTLLSVGTTPLRPLLDYAGAALAVGAVTYGGKYVATYTGTEWRLAGGSGATGGLFAGVSSKSANYTVVASDARYLIECSTSLTLSLTAAATLGNGFTFAAWNSGTGTVIIDPAGSETINDGATLTLQAGQWALITCTGTAWKAPTQPGQSSCTWSPTDKEAALVVSANGLTASVASGGAMQSGRGTKALSGKRYFEIILDVKAASGPSAFVGIATLAATFSSDYGIGESAGGYAYADDTGRLLHARTETTFGATWNAAGVVIGVAYDDVSTPGSVKLWFSRNGVWQGGGDPATGASPAFTISAATFYPAITCKNGGQITARFSAAFWTYAAPSGFSQIP